MATLEELQAQMREALAEMATKRFGKVEGEKFLERVQRGEISRRDAAKALVGDEPREIRSKRSRAGRRQAADKKPKR